MATDYKSIAKLANTRPDEQPPEYDKGTVHKLGSRVTSKQANVVLDTVTRGQREKLVGNDGIDTLRAYADTGDRSYLTAEQSEVLSKVCDAAKGKLETDSQKRRVWPRKAAAAIVASTMPVPVEADEPVAEDSDTE